MQWMRYWRRFYQRESAIDARPPNPLKIMSTISAAHFSSLSDALPAIPDSLNDRLAEAANYAVLRRMMPVLRHDVAGAMQPVRMLLMVLERRMQAPEPDLAAITKNVASLSGLAKQATADCIGALEWIGSSHDAQVSLRSSVDEAIKLLAMELSANGLELVNGIADDAATAPQSFLRSVLMGALLAFCDQRAQGSALQVTYTAADSHQRGQLRLAMLPDDASKLPASLDIVRKYRLMDWPDVEAMARSFSVKLERGDGWLTLGLPVD